MTDPRLPVAVVVEGDGTVIACSAAAAPFIEGGGPGGKLRLGAAEAAGAEGAGWVEDAQGARLAARVEARPLGAGGQRLVVVGAPADVDRRRALHRALMHDLRSPLATVQLLCQSLGVELERIGGEAAAVGGSYLSRALSELVRMNQMLDVCRAFVSSDHPPSPQVDVSGLLAAIARRHDRALRRAGVTLRLSPGPEHLTFFDAGVLSAVVGALLTVAQEAGGQEAGWLGLSHAPGEVVVTAPRLAGVELDAVLGDAALGPDRLSWLEVCLMTARWLAEGEGGRILGRLHPDGSAQLVLRLRGA